MAGAWTLRPRWDGETGPRAGSREIKVPRKDEHNMFAEVLRAAGFLGPAQHFRRAMRQFVGVMNFRPGAEGDKAENTISPLSDPIEATGRRHIPRQQRSSPLFVARVFGPPLIRCPKAASVPRGCEAEGRRRATPVRRFHGLGAAIPLHPRGSRRRPHSFPHIDETANDTPLGGQWTFPAPAA